MRIRAVVAIVSLLLPAALSAQRVPLPGSRRGPARPAPLPPQPGPIATELAYKRLRLTVESYPLISYVQSSGFAANGPTAWTFGAGTRADYRLTPKVSATLDLTSSFLGGPAITQTAELGTRVHPERSERRVYPFVDFRIGYISAYNKNPDTFVADPFIDPAAQGSYAQYSRGFGAVGGVGMEYALTRSFSLTTAASVMRSRMTPHSLEGVQTGPRHYTMTSYRYTLGISYNPVRLIRPAETNLR